MESLKSRVEDILETCVLCPGICISNCPVFTTSRMRSTSPNSIARIILKGLRLEKREYLNVAFYCNYCKRCERVCPISNKLAEALKTVRAYIVGKEERYSPTLVALGGKGKKVLIVSTQKPKELLLKNLREAFDVYWIDTKELTPRYWYGLLNLEEIKDELKGHFDYILLEDIDLPLLEPEEVLKQFASAFTSIKIEQDYILHVPCKLKEPYTSESVFKLLNRKASKVINVCSGALLKEKAKRVADLILKSFERKLSLNMPVVTLCRRTQELLKIKGYRSCTLLDLMVMKKC